MLGSSVVIFGKKGRGVAVAVDRSQRSRPKKKLYSTLKKLQNNEIVLVFYDKIKFKHQIYNTGSHFHNA